MNGILLAAWLMLGWLPNGGLAVYDPPTLIDVSGSYLVELGAEASWGPVFAGGSMQVPVWQHDGFTFWPSQLVSTTDIGVEVGPIRLGWRHTCAHPVTPYLERVQWYEGQLVPRWDSAYDFIYLRIGVRRTR
ncbi:MAG TPA: hypothetical protein VJ553_05270 [Candidatus Paceibacterota bacterium]|nr:hypothetical protein [Candidatus Paceibacterota bacterium]